MVASSSRLGSSGKRTCPTTRASGASGRGTSLMGGPNGVSITLWMVASPDPLWEVSWEVYHAVTGPSRGVGADNSVAALGVSSGGPGPPANLLALRAPEAHLPEYTRPAALAQGSLDAPCSARRDHRRTSFPGPLQLRRPSPHPRGSSELRLPRGVQAEVTSDRSRGAENERLAVERR